MTEATRALVRHRAENRCEYCQLHEDDTPSAGLQIDHIRPRKHGGSDDPSNLCLSCVHCNLHKGTNLTGIDPITDAVTELYRPRRQRWEDHFTLAIVFIFGSTARGRTTVAVLDMNSDEQVALRAES